MSADLFRARPRIGVHSTVWVQDDLPDNVNVAMYGKPANLSLSFTTEQARELGEALICAADAIRRSDMPEPKAKAA